MFFHTFSLTRYLLSSFQELQVTLPLLLNKKFYSVGLELLMFFAVVKSTANRDDRNRGRGRGLAVRGRGPRSRSVAVEIWTVVLPLGKTTFFRISPILERF